MPRTMSQSTNRYTNKNDISKRTHDLGVAMQCALHENRQAEKNAVRIYLSAPLTGGRHMAPPEL